MTGLQGERGFALVITLIITALLVALATQFIDEVFVETSARQNYLDAQQASLMANSGIDVGLKLLKFNLDARNYTTLSDQWAKPLQFDDEQGALEVTIEDESGKLNLNQVVGSNGNPTEPYYSIANRLLKRDGLSLDLLDALSDWLDENEDPNPGGAEKSYYALLKQPYSVKNAKLDTLEELMLIKGFNIDTVNRLRRHVTVYSDNPTVALININTAPKPVLAALTDDMTDELAKRVIEHRTTTPFTQKADLVKVPGLDTIGMKLQTSISVKGTVYRVRSKATVKETTRTVEAVVNMTLSPPPVLYWREF